MSVCLINGNLNNLKDQVHVRKFQVITRKFQVITMKVQVLSSRKFQVIILNTDYGHPMKA